MLAASTALSGCGVPATGPTAAGEPARGGLSTDGAGLLRLYFLTREGTWPATRPAASRTSPQRALDALVAGPDSAERKRGLKTRVPSGGQRVRAEMSGAAVDVRLPWPVAGLDHLAVDQLVCTAAAAGARDGGKPYGVTVRVYEPGSPASPWRVGCDETGAAAPLGGPDR